MLNKWASDQTRYFHISRKPKLVEAQNGDSVAFWSEILTSDASDGMNIWRDDSLNFSQYETLNPISIGYGERVLLWARASAGQIAGGLRWVSYVVNVLGPNKGKLMPLREIYNPEVIYNKETNTLEIWFWTNIDQVHGGYYSEDLMNEVMKINEFSDVIEGPQDVPYVPTMHRVLCYAKGSFQNVYVEGGDVQGYTLPAESMTLSNAQWDLVPIFEQPILIEPQHGYQFSTGTQGPQGLVYGAGVVADGWYMTGTSKFGETEIVVDSTWIDGAYSLTKITIPYKTTYVDTDAPAAAFECEEVF